MLRYRRLMAVLVLAALTPAAWAASEPSFTLGKAVPADAFLCVQGAYNPKAEFLHKYWGEVWTEVKNSGAIEDVHELIGSLVPPADREKFDGFWKRANELLNAVDWDARIEECTFAERMNPPMPEFMAMLRYESAEKAAKNGEAFMAMLKELETATGGENSGLTPSDAEAHGAKIHTLTLKALPFINIRVAVRESVVVLAMDHGMVDESLALLAGEGGKKSLVEGERYKQAMAKLPKPEDAAVFLDIKAMIEGLRGLFVFWSQQGQPNQSSQEFSTVIGKVLDEANMFDYMASTAHTEGYRRLDDTIVTLAPDASKSRLYKVFCQPEPMEKFDRFVPKEATAYSVSSGVNLGALYAAALDFVGKEVPNGQEAVTHWGQVQDQMGFHPDRDIFSWLGQQMVSVTLPLPNPTPFAKADTVFMIKVRDEKVAAEKIKAGLDKLNDMMAGAGSPLTSQPADVAGGTGFRTVTHPMVAMFLHPVYGVADGYVMIGSSSHAIATCLATAKGEHPSVSKSERVTREGLIPKGAATAASFEDMTHLGDDLSQGLQAMGMVTGMITGMIPLPPNDPSAKGVIDAIRKVGPILAKLSPAAKKLDFFVSKSSVTTFEKNAWHTRSVVNYRDPKAKAAETPAPSGT